MDRTVRSSLVTLDSWLVLYANQLNTCQYRNTAKHEETVRTFLGRAGFERCSTSTGAPPPYVRNEKRAR
jgi:hypothetical protein